MIRTLNWYLDWRIVVVIQNLPGPYPNRAGDPMDPSHSRTVNGLPD